MGCVVCSGTGTVRSPVLKISMLMGGGFDCSLIGQEQPCLKFLRFHMGSQGADHILNTPALRGMLASHSAGKLNDFIAQLGDQSTPERTYAKLGQSYLSQVMYT
jgi:hypothetical protein